MAAHTSAVLIIEHDPLIQSLYARTLQHEYVVLTAQTVEQCEMYCRRLDLRVVIIEPHRPDGLGAQLLDILQQQLRTRHVPIIVCSVLNAQRASQDAGIFRYLVKPISPDVLRQLVLQI
ncbi:MAG: response regulator [Chloroflexales bacterium]|jgi:response regulator of citrate/malate metabolism|nr:response regulator [Chloroflexales bacterium]